jgi:hypothetical protein
VQSLSDLKADIAAARKVARLYGFAANDKETCEGLTRNILAVWKGQTDLLKKEITALKKEIAKLKR